MISPRLPSLLAFLVLASAAAGQDRDPSAAPDGTLGEPSWGQPVRPFGPDEGLLLVPDDGAVVIPDPLAAADLEARARARDESLLWGFGITNRSPVRLRSQWEPSAPVIGQPTDLETWRYDLTLQALLWQNDLDRLVLSLGAATSQFDTAAVFPDSGRPFPNDLWNIRIGGNYIRNLSNGWTGGLGINVFSASDQPFAEPRDVKVGATAFLRIPVNDRDAWNFALSYSPLSELPYPLPGIAYQWEPSEDLRMNIGVPFRLMYRPHEDLTIDLSYLPIRSVHAQATWRIVEPWRAYVAFDWENQAWFLNDRANDQERLFYYDKRLSIGLQATLLGSVALDLSAGYLFDRVYFTGENFSDSHHDRIDVGNGLFVWLQASLKW